MDRAFAFCSYDDCPDNAGNLVGFLEKELTIAIG